MSPPAAGAGDAARIAETTLRHEAWQRRYFEPRPKALAEKREKMAEDPFAFLRGSFHLWPGVLARLRPEVAGAGPALLCVGDTHLENFGSWRDAEGRLVWGVNDLDEAATLPFASDLLRLAASFLLEAERSPGKIQLAPEQGVVHLLDGYRAGLAHPPGPFILENRHPDLRDLATVRGEGALKWWTEMEEDVGAEEPPPDLRDLLLTHLPSGARVRRLGKRRAGLGSRERPRFAVVAEWDGGTVVREAKAAAPSAARSGEAVADPLADHARLHLLARRSRDPFFRLLPGAGGKPGEAGRGWVVRRLSPESDKIEVGKIEAAKPGKDGTGTGIAARQALLLGAMGGEIANVHLGALGQATPLQRALDALDRRPGWFPEAAEAAATAVRLDHAAFCEARERGLLG